jgi:sulfite exporter TauE/SafE
MEIIPIIDGNIGIIITMFLTGLFGSLTHCILMCGPIAAAQASMRLMGSKATEINQFTRFNSALLLPYYFGKAATYMLLSLITYYISVTLKDLLFIKAIAFTLLITTAFFFVKSGFSKTFAFLDGFKFKPFKKLTNFIMNSTNPQIYLYPYGIRGFFLGMMLGLIPCGLVYAVIVATVSLSSSLMIILLSMLAFGLSTVPGLFFSAFLGSQFIRGYSRVFGFIYSLLMFFNAYVLVGYALKLL